MRCYKFGSLTRTSDLQVNPFTVHPLKRDQWATGDYVVGKYCGVSTDDEWVENTSGRHARVLPGDLLVGTFGVRRATLEATGDWNAIGPDGLMEDLTHAGLFGKETSRATSAEPHPRYEYVGHVIRDGAKVCMKDFVVKPPNSSAYACPTILIIGTSMSSGKTTAGRVIIRLLKDMGLPKVVAAKLAGAGCYSDIMSMLDAGADAVFDFVDAGLPSSIVPADQYKESLGVLLSMISAQSPDVVVAEVGASPFEPYNGSLALEEMGSRAEFIVLCASDPYAAVGAKTNFGVKVDLVTGIATSTDPGADMVEKVSGLPSLSLCTDESIKTLRKLLTKAVRPKLS